ncbi:MAG: hypothetical protein ACE5HI_16870 [bacterium]
MQASQDTYEKPQGELMINLVTIERRKTADTPWPKWQVVRKWCLDFIISMLVARPGDSESLRVLQRSVDWNVVKPNNLNLKLDLKFKFKFKLKLKLELVLMLGNEKCVVRGCWKKRTHSSNNYDRAVLVLHHTKRKKQEYSTRKSADFQLVLTIKKSWEHFTGGDVKRC